MCFGIIYKVTNRVNNKVYIGQTVCSLKDRYIKHISLSNVSKPVTHFHRALKKYGTNNFVLETIEWCDSKEELDEMEFHYIKQFDSYKNGYNMTLGGEGSLGRAQSTNTKLKISNSKKGSTVSRHTKEKLSKIHKGIKKSKEHINKVAFSKSKYWLIIYPDNTQEIIRNLSKFCREHSLSDRGMWMVANNIRTHHKGFRCKKYNRI